jgi:hypothetical protein
MSLSASGAEGHRIVSMVSGSLLDRGRRLAAGLLSALIAALVASGPVSADSRKDGPQDGPPLSRRTSFDPTQRSSRWTFSAETIVLGRSGTGNQPLVSLVPGTVPWLTLTGTNTTNYPGVEVLNSNQLGQRLAAGPRISLAYRDPSGYGAELTYFNVLGLSAAKSIGPQTPGQWLVMKAPGTFWQTQDYGYQAMQWQDDTSLHSVEAHARLDLSPRVTLLAGVRWLRLRDQLQGTLSPDDLGQPLWKTNVFPATLADAVPTTSAIVVNPPFWTTTTTNNLYGIQIGATVRIWESARLSVEATIKTGVYDNQASQTTLVSMQKQLYPATSSTSAAAFVSEGSLIAKYQLTDGIAVKLGYDALWFDRIALAPGQIQAMTTTQTSVGALGVNRRSTTLLQGLTFGLEYAF